MVSRKYFYVYDEDGSNRRENITDWALEQFRTHYGSTLIPGPSPGRRGEKKRDITKWDIFYYVYGLLHHPGYRTKFADNLKRELPRIPLAPAVASVVATGGSPVAGAKATGEPEYIVRLVGQVVRVSVETVRIVNSLPENYA